MCQSAFQPDYGCWALDHNHPAGCIYKYILTLCFWRWYHPKKRAGEWWMLRLIFFLIFFVATSCHFFYCALSWFVPPSVIPSDWSRFCGACTVFVSCKCEHATRDAYPNGAAPPDMVAVTWTVKDTLSFYNAYWLYTVYIVASCGLDGLFGFFALKLLFSMSLLLLLNSCQLFAPYHNV